MDKLEKCKTCSKHVHDVEVREDESWKNILERIIQASGIASNKEFYIFHDIDYIYRAELNSKGELEIKNAIEKDLKTFDNTIVNAISFEQFLRWISYDHTIYIQYGNKNIMIATSLIRLDDIYYDESVSGNSSGPYPSI